MEIQNYRNEKLKIALFIDSFYPMIDGVITVVDKYARDLSPYADVTVFCPDCGKLPDLPYKVVTCTSIPFNKTGYNFGLPITDPEFLNQIVKGEYDLFHIHSPFSVGRTAVHLGKHHKIPTVITAHSQFKQDVEKAVKNGEIVKLVMSEIIKPFNACDEVWAVNDRTAELFKDYGVEKDIEIMPNYTDMVYTDASTDEIDDELNLKGKKVLLFVGRSIKEKGILFIADSLRHVKSDCIVVFCGDGPDKDELVKRIDEYNLTDKVRFTTVNDRDKLALLYKRANLLLFPSVYDTDGLVKAEAAAQNTPTLFIENTLCSGGITDNVNGFIEKGDEFLYASRIDKLLENPVLLQTVGVNAHNGIYRTKQQAIEKIYKEYLRIIDEYKKKEVDI